MVKILGSRDCVAPADDARANAARLPPHTRWIEIAGGNHAQSDITDRRINDCSANIDREMQQAAARDAVIALLHAVDRGGP